MKMSTLVFMVTLALATGTAAAQATTISVTLEPGRSWLQQRQMGPITTEVSPHVAVWLEDLGGAYLGTVFVSLKDGRQDFWAGNRPHPLPVWLAAAGTGRLGDAITGPSPAPREARLLTWSRPWPRGLETVVIRAEINMAGDWNSTWTEKHAAPWGQPALLYRGEALAGGSLVLAVQGQGTGLKGTWKEGTQGLDSALDLVARIVVQVR